MLGGFYRKLLLRVKGKKSKGRWKFDYENPSYIVFAHGKHDLQLVDDGERSRCYGIMPHHTPLWIHQEEVSGHGEGAEAQKGGYYLLRNEENMQKEAGWIIFTPQDFRNIDDMIKLYALD